MNTAGETAGQAIPESDWRVIMENPMESDYFCTRKACVYNIINIYIVSEARVRPWAQQRNVAASPSRIYIHKRSLKIVS